MADPFIGEIRMFAFNFAPRNWAQCDGQMISPNENPALFSLLDTNFGGDGNSNFKLPDFRGRVPIHEGRLGDYYFSTGDSSGFEKVELSIPQLPSHHHELLATDATASKSRVTKNKDTAFASTNNNEPIYSVPKDQIPLNADTGGVTGGDGAHYNMMPSLVINFCIALDGLYPSRN